MGRPIFEQIAMRMHRGFQRLILVRGDRRRLVGMLQDNELGDVAPGQHFVDVFLGDDDRGWMLGAADGRHAQGADDFDSRIDGQVSALGQVGQLKAIDVTGPDFDLGWHVVADDARPIGIEDGLAARRSQDANGQDRRLGRRWRERRWFLGRCRCVMEQQPKNQDDKVRRRDSAPTCHRWFSLSSCTLEFRP
jgi:hypothetical protein